MSSAPDYVRMDPGQIKNVSDIGNIVVGPQNKFNEQAYTLFNGGLTFQDNVQVPKAQTTFKVPSTYSNGANSNFNVFTFLAPKSGISAVIVGQITDTSGAVLLNPVFVTSWTENNPAQITVNYMTGLTPGSTYKVTFLAV